MLTRSRELHLKYSQISLRKTPLGLGLGLSVFSKIQLVVYDQCCVLIG